MKIKRFNEGKDNSNAQEFMDEYQTWFDDEAGDMVISTQDCKEVMIEFVKMHVRKALESASKPLNSPYNKGNKVDREVHDIDIILNSYPLENIK